MVPAAYARVMFLGVGGSGKSSVLDGLMNKKRRTAESTALADTLNIRYHWVEAADAAEDAWKLVQEEDELEELASLSRKVLASKTEGTGNEAKAEASIIKKWATARAVLFLHQFWQLVSLLVVPLKANIHKKLLRSRVR